MLGRPGVDGAEIARVSDAYRLRLAIDPIFTADRLGVSGREHLEPCRVAGRRHASTQVLANIPKVRTSGLVEET